MENTPTYQELLKENQELKEKLSIALKKIEELEKVLYKKNIQKNSHNSNKPPSSDLTRKNKSLRGQSNRKTGGQTGHKGSTLNFVEDPDTIEKLIPQYCNLCGEPLPLENIVLKSKRQVIDVPEIKPLCIEYQNYSIKCSCGHNQEAGFPAGVNGNIQYGNRTESLVSYFSVFQYIPFKRLGSMLKDVFNMPMSQGTIGNILERVGLKSKPVYDVIKEKVEYSDSVGSDETGAKVNGKKWWAWVWQTVFATYIHITDSRGKKVIDELFPNGFVNAILSSDRWRAQLNTYAKGHQLCLAHLLRSLQYLIELEGSTFATNLKTLFLQAIKLKQKKQEYNKGTPEVKEVEDKFDQLLQTELDKEKYEHTLTFLNSMKEHRQNIFTFLYNKNVQPDNNSSERAIRNLKVKLKISGQFKSGQESFARIRSIIDTCNKQRIGVLQSLMTISQIDINTAE